jgi:dTMP kinase
MARAAFITVEGLEGVGKSTSLELIARELAAAGHVPRVTREPGGTPLGEQIRSWVLHAEHGRLAAEVEALLMFAARAQHLADVIRPALDEGIWVVCDRFTDASYAYQGAGRGAARQFLDQLASGVQHGLQPDLTLLLDAPVATGLARIRDRELDHFEREDAAFFERVRGEYLRRWREDPERIKRIDAGASMADVHSQIQAELGAFLARHEAR